MARDNWMSPEIRKALEEAARRERAAVDARPGWPPPSKPLPADGIKARSKRGRIGETWWSARFVEALEAMGVGGRLDRGKHYARAGQVLSLDVRPGAVRAKVQGSRTEPYSVRITVDVIGERDWERALDVLAERASFAARLLSGEMPHEIVDVFAEGRAGLFPSSPSELEARCTCPDFVEPCKHAAASLYLLAEAFDDDPFLVLRLRGRDRDDVLAGIRDRQMAATGMAPAPLEADGFWRADAALDAVVVRPHRAADPAAFVRTLGPAGIDVSGTDLAEVLATCYEAIAVRAEELGAG